MKSRNPKCPTNEQIKYFNSFNGILGWGPGGDEVWIVFVYSFLFVKNRSHCFSPSCSQIHGYLPKASWMLGLEAPTTISNSRDTFQHGQILKGWSWSSHSGKRSPWLSKNAERRATTEMKRRRAAERSHRVPWEVTHVLSLHSGYGFPEYTIKNQSLHSDLGNS